MRTKVYILSLFVVFGFFLHIHVVSAQPPFPDWLSTNVSTVTSGGNVRVSYVIPSRNDLVALYSVSQTLSTSCLVRASGSWGSSEITASTSAQQSTRVTGNTTHNPTSDTTYDLLCTWGDGFQNGSGGAVLDSAVVTIFSASSGPEITVTPLSYNFGIQTIGAPVSAVFAVRNVGSGTVTGSVSGLSNPFSCISAGCSGYSVNAGDPPLIITIQYDPISGPSSDTAIFSCPSCLNGDQSVTLSGEGQVALPGAPIVNLLPDSPNPVASGDPITLSWNNVNLGNSSDSCQLEDQLSFVSWNVSPTDSGSFVVNPASSRAYQLTCTNTTGSASDTVSVSVVASPPPPPPPPLPTARFWTNPPNLGGPSTPNPNPTVIAAGDSVTLAWDSTNTISCSAVSGTGFNTGGNTSGSDSITSPLYDETYTLRCTNVGGVTVDQSITIGVQPGIGSFTVPSQVIEGDAISISWSNITGTNTTCSGETMSGDDGGWNSAGITIPSGSVLVGPILNDSSYRLVCSNPHGNALSGPRDVAVLRPTGALTASPQQVLKGRTVEISWSVAYVQSAVIEYQTASSPTWVNVYTYPGPVSATGINGDGTLTSIPITEPTKYRLTFGTLTGSFSEKVVLDLDAFVPDFNEE